MGYLENSREVVCNVCIFEKKLMAVKFTALVSKELRAEFNAAFAQYKNGINQINGVDTNLVRQRAAILVQNFFSQIREKVKLLQRQSMSKCLVKKEATIMRTRLCINPVAFSSRMPASTMG